MLADHLHEAGWIVSPKSQVIPATNVSWMGKELRGDDYTLLQSAEYMPTTTAIWIQLATNGYRHRTMWRLCGKLIWASRPGTRAMPFLTGALAWRQVYPAGSLARAHGGYRAQPNALAGAPGSHRSRGNLVRGRRL